MTPTQRTRARPRRQNLIGIFGMPGSGKTHLLNQLRKELEGCPFSFHDSDEIEKDPSGYCAYNSAIRAIRRKCDQSAVTGIATAKYMELNSQERHRRPLMLDNGEEGQFTHIMYVNTPVEVAYQRFIEDNKKAMSVGDAEGRPRECPLDVFRAWAKEEIKELQAACLDRHIMFTMVDPSNLPRIITLIHNFQLDRDGHEKRNQAIVNQRIDELVARWQGHVERVVVMDCDDTLATKDVEHIFWEKYYFGDDDHPDEGHRQLPEEHHDWERPREDYFQCRQACFAYEQVVAEGRFDEICSKAGSASSLVPPFGYFLHLASKYPHIRIILVTSGPRLLWERILAREGLSRSVWVIGSDPISVDYVVTPSVKENLMKRLAEVHNLHVWAFRDAHPYEYSYTNEAWFGYEPLLPVLASRVNESGDRLDRTSLRLIALEQPEVLEKLFLHQFALFHTTHKGIAKLLHERMLKTGEVPVHVWRKKIRIEAAEYLTHQYMRELPELQGNAIVMPEEPEVTGYPLFHDGRVLIVPLTEDSSPMAPSFKSAFGESSVLEVSQATDIHLDQLLEIDAVVLVDSVVDSADNIARFVHHIRRLRPRLKVFIMVGVLQAELVAPGGPLPSLGRGGPIRVAALSLAKGKDPVDDTMMYETEYTF
ncbi:hypothetical protein ASPBRDRAFT_190361 [Aspergillus brasiliensis CBS 101740]|uniref:Uracil phosphoribosyltransferase n=1 Tax=Aspergillus brasiliensis (strain CBS 101740 / IMI 381727 / IBT 21946) TaxID=767769 RepID=A0A1L9UZM2_ASPBC|nr:hypothetical protein ASPBRDRAFT_190361 [Aspergillus brasiliensis CBS 101740]